VGNVKQVFVLTHNVYFHKEVTFNPRRKNTSLSDETFWIVKKVDGVSSLTQNMDNPIKTSYELLWAEIKCSNASLTSLQNTMRRILEYYFRILGGWKDWNFDAWFEGQELLICQSLLSWVNDGSHFPDDDLHYRVSPESIEIYKKVFRSIFEKTQHIEHYNMMMQTTVA
jgi:wobble nucleotide-excising tRNase